MRKRTYRNYALKLLYCQVGGNFLH